MFRVAESVGLFPLQSSADESEIKVEISDDSMLPHYENKHPKSTEAAAAFVASLRTSRPKMVVFDKDGTLADCTESLRRWVLHMTDRLRKVIALPPTETEQLIKEFHEHIGWDVARNDVVPSAPVAAGTWEDILAVVYQFLLQHRSKCKETVSLQLAQKWSLELGDLHGQDKPVLDDLKGMMRTCQRLGYLVGICTSDDRAGTEVAMKAWGIDTIVDVSICGDEVSRGKPSAVPLQALCRRASNYLQQKQGTSAPDMLPQDCIMVGDTNADTGTARAAKAGFCVGVLTGSGTAEQLLDTGAHLILPHVGHIPALLEKLEGIASDSQESQYR